MLYYLNVMLLPFLAIMEEDCRPVVAVQYHSSGCHYLGRLKQGWKDQEHL